MKTSSILDTYQTWLTHREYSPATIQKYTKALARFFADTGAGDIPTRETVAAWRDSLTEKGYTPATVNAMLAAVNDYQESIDNVAGKAKPLKHQRRIFADPGRELTRAEYFRLLNAARAAGNKRTQLLLEALCSTGTRVSELQFITAEAVRRHKASIRCKGKCSVRCRLKSPAAIVSRQLTNANDTKAAITANMPYPNDWSAETVAALISGLLGTSTAENKSFGDASIDSNTEQNFAVIHRQSRKKNCIRLF